MTRLHRTRHATPSMVPLADMLTNTVGVVIFILIFTVLAAGGASFVKRLPIEQPRGNARPIEFACIGGRIYFLDDAPLERLVKDAGPVSKFEDFAAFRQRFDGKTARGADVLVTGRAGLAEVDRGGFKLVRAMVRADYTIDLQAGESATAIGGPDSRIRAALAALDRDRSFAYFRVSPDGIDAFQAARDVAAGLGLRVGWTPHTTGNTLNYTLSGGEGDQVPQ
jgi:hypothetical protein